MARTKRIVAKVVRMLREQGPKNSVEILNLINDHTSQYHMRAGTTPNTLVNVLSKNACFTKTWDTENESNWVRAYNGDAYPVCTWETNEDWIRSKHQRGGIPFVVPLALEANS